MFPNSLTPRLAPMAAALLIAGALMAGCDRDDAVPPPPAPPTPQASAGTTASATPTDTPEPPKAPESVEIGDIRNVHLVAECYTAGAPTPDDFKLLAERGVTTVVNLREPSEGDMAAEKSAAQAAGLAYVHIPFSKPETLTDEVFDRFRATMKEHGGKDVFVHCGSANRVGAVWMAYRSLDGGLSVDAAEAEARAIGLRTDWLAEKATDYIERHR